MAAPLLISLALHLGLLSLPGSPFAGRAGAPAAAVPSPSFTARLETTPPKPVVRPLPDAPTPAAMPGMAASVTASVPPPAPTTTPATTPTPAPAPAVTAPRETEPAGVTPYRPRGVLAGPWYYPARYLHRTVKPLKPIQPDYPEPHKDVPGRVQLLLMVNERGGVDDHRLVMAEPPGVFEEATIAAFVRETYAPGLITGMAVRAQLLVEVVFEPGSDPRVGLPALPMRPLAEGSVGR